MTSTVWPTGLNGREEWAEYFSLRRSAEPHVHQIEPTNHCPYSCVMCPRSQKMTRATGFMSLQLYRQVIDEIATFAEPVRSREIELFHFGESLLHPEIDAMVAYAVERQLKVSLSVNAPHLTPAITERLLAAGLPRLIISLDGSDQESYQQIRGPAADFAKAVANISYLAKRISDTSVALEASRRIIRMNATEALLDDFRRQWEGSGLPVEVRPFFPWSEAELAPLGIVEKYPPGMVCPFPWQYLVVQWDGTVVPCCRDYNGVNSIGNVREQSLREIWHGPRLREFYRQHRSGEYGGNDFCRRCMAIFSTPPRSAQRDSDAGCLTMAALWKGAVTKYPERPLVSWRGDGGVISYGDAAELVDRVAGRLWHEGIRPGDFLGLVCAAHPEALFLVWAAWQIGAAVGCIDHRLPQDRMAEMLKRLAPKLIFCDSERAAVGAVAKRLPVVFDALADQPATDLATFSSWLEGGATCRDWERIAPGESDPAVVLFTSGTTGAPRGVVLSQGAIARSGQLMAQTYLWRPDDLVLSLGELSTMSGLRIPLAAVPHAGCSFLLATETDRAHASAIADCLSQGGVSILATTPALVRQFVQHQNRLATDGESRLRQVLCTGSALAPEWGDRFEQQFNIPLYNYYGLTETAGICIGARPGEVSPRGSIGVPLGCTVRVTDPAGKPLATGELGELWIKTPNLMLGYLDDATATGAVVDAGWFKTGDLACLGIRGEVYVLDRLGDAIKDDRGDFMMLTEIDQALESHPLVVEAGVCGVHHAEAGRQLVALVVAREARHLGPDQLNELRDHVSGRLGPLRTPEVIRQVGSLPRGVSGKLLRRDLLELLK